MLNPNEEVFVVARQSRLKPSGSKFTPNIIFATDRRIIIDPSILGLREQIVYFPYGMISSVKLDKGVFSSNIIFATLGVSITLTQIFLVPFVIILLNLYYPGQWYLPFIRILNVAIGAAIAVAVVYLLSALSGSRLTFRK
jgi:Bacterial PH domain